VQSLYRLELPAIPLPSTDAGLLDTVDSQLLAEAPRVWMIVNGTAATRQQFETEIQRRLEGLAVSNRREFGTVLVLRMAK
jgi:hypothetical protein